VDAAIKEGCLAELLIRRDRARAEGRLYGIGYAVIVEPSTANMGYVTTALTLQERAPAGAKSVGEGNSMSTPVCLANTVADALGVADLALPLTPSRVAALLPSASLRRNGSAG
jgi:hypothetical protein